MPQSEEVGVEGSGKEHGALNPLMTDVVLMKLFDLCEVSQLLNYRLVCRQWHDLSLARIQNEATVRIGVDIDFHNAAQCNWPMADDLSKVMHEAVSRGESFKCFSLFKMDFLTAPPPSSLLELEPELRRLFPEEMLMIFEKRYESMLNFWRTFGPFITKLELSQCSVICAKALRKAIFEDTPNLKELKMDHVNCKTWGDWEAERFKEEDIVPVQNKLKFLSLSDKGRSDDDVFPISFLLVFLQFPQIQRLVLSIFGEDPTTPLVKAYESLDEIRLKDLQLVVTSKQDVSSARTLLSLDKLKLEKLDLRIWRAAGKSILQAALRQNGDTLQKLVVESWLHNFEYDDSVPTNNFPFRRKPLERLTHLELTGKVYQNCNFLEKTPNLRVLRIRRGHNLRGEIEVRSGTTLPFLKEFCFEAINGPDGYLSREEMNGFVKATPNVELFVGDVDTSAFRELCKGWVKLTYLHITSNDIDDKALLGLEKSGTGDEERLPNIMDLKYLTTFHCRLTSGTVGVSCIWDGFLKMPQLRTLSIALLHKNIKDWLTGDEVRALEALRNHLPGTRITSAIQQEEVRDQIEESDESEEIDEIDESDEIDE